MQITYLGHAGFCVETAATIVIMDPWLSTAGAFDAAWFQYPKNEHMQDYVYQLLRDSPKDKYIYISHEHQDHYDIDFLHSVLPHSFRILLPCFDHPVVKKQLEAHHVASERIIVLANETTLALPDAEVTLFILDTEMNCDSAILMHSPSGTFLNANDCKIQDRWQNIVKKYGKIDVFTAQFSGASWYPTCYSMPKAQYQRVCEAKVMAKFEATAQAIESLAPRIYLPSAGPPCFLDPMLFPLNFASSSVYPHAPALLDYLAKRLTASLYSSRWSLMHPGDSLEVESLLWTRAARDPLADSSYVTYLEAYALEKKTLFAERAAAAAMVDTGKVFIDLKDALLAKLEPLCLVNHTVTTPIYWGLQDYVPMYRLDLARKTLSLVLAIDDPEYVQISAPAWQVRKVLDQKLTWSEFALTLRARLCRVPEVYNTIIHGFLILEPTKIASFCEKLAATYHNAERIIVVNQGKQYSVLRFCPHQGADLSASRMEGAYLICPRHQWKFDLHNQGNCVYNNASIHAIAIEND